MVPRACTRLSPPIKYMLHTDKFRLDPDTALVFYDNAVSSGRHLNNSLMDMEVRE